MRNVTLSCCVENTKYIAIIIFWFLIFVLTIIGYVAILLVILAFVYIIEGISLLIFLGKRKENQGKYLEFVCNKKYMSLIHSFRDWYMKPAIFVVEDMGIARWFRKL